MPRKRAISPDRVFVEARPELGGTVVKSVQRVVEIFELFNDLKAPVTVIDVASRLNTPQSSTSALLRSLHTLGYLGFNGENRTYCPTGRLALLGHWIEPLLIREGPAIQMTRQVTEQTGHDSYLAVRNNLNIQVVFRQYATSPTIQSPTGSGSFLTKTATGHVLMSRLGEREVVKLVTAVNARLPDTDDKVSARGLVETLNMVRTQGYAIGQSHRSQNRTTIALLLPDVMADEMAFGLNLPSQDVSPPVVDRCVELMRAAVGNWLSPNGMATAAFQG